MMSNTIVKWEETKAGTMLTSYRGQTLPKTRSIVFFGSRIAVVKKKVPTTKSNDEFKNKEITFVPRVNQAPHRLRAQTPQTPYVTGVKRR